MQERKWSGVQTPNPGFGEASAFVCYFCFNFDNGPSIISPSRLIPFEGKQFSPTFSRRLPISPLRLGCAIDFQLLFACSGRYGSVSWLLFPRGIPVSPGSIRFKSVNLMAFAPLPQVTYHLRV